MRNKFVFLLSIQGLKTGMYYLRTKPAAQAIQFTVDKTRLSETNKTNTRATTPSDKTDKISLEQTNGADAESEDKENKRNQNMAVLACSLKNREDCLMCGS